MKNQVPDVKTIAAKRLSPELDEFLHMLKSLESNGKALDVAPLRG